MLFNQFKLDSSFHLRFEYACVNRTSDHFALPIFVTKREHLTWLCEIILGGRHRQCFEMNKHTLLMTRVCIYYTDLYLGICYGNIVTSY